MGEMPQIVAFRDTMDPLLDEFTGICTKFGQPLDELAVLVKDCFQKLQELMHYGFHNDAPTGAAPCVQPLSNAINAVGNFRNKNRSHAQFGNHLAAVSESILALSWITIKPAPTQFIKEMIPSSEYYGNRILATFKGNPEHLGYINKWYEILQNLQAYVKQYFLTGFTWGSAKGAGGAAPPPPPPPPMFPLGGENQSGATGDGARQALLNDLNQGTGITNRLKHIDRHALKSAEPSAPAGGKAPVTATQKPIKPVPSNPPKFILEGRKWVVAYQKSNHGMNVQNDDMSQSLLMHNCDDCFLNVENKINNVIIDSCKKTNLVIRDVISSVEVIRCTSLKIQCEGSVPLINLSGCDSCEVYVTESSRNVEIISSKSSALNVCLMKPDGDYTEMPVPEQIRCVIGAKNNLHSTVVENI